ncbi:laccase, multicopper oxidase, benzenediol:oxygen oxidorectuctase [Marasmius sp. AFHP31]|nr:laccase, multicopper oxidase, benzenediol:oxygen oxidorectuctase [Marasmius sp. AFHP31]
MPSKTSGLVLFEAPGGIDGVSLFVRFCGIVLFGGFYRERENIAEGGEEEGSLVQILEKVDVSNKDQLPNSKTFLCFRCLPNLGAPGLPFPGGVDHAINLHLSTSGDKFAFNGALYESPSLPVLLQVLSGAREPGSLLSEGSVYELPANSTIKVSFTGRVTRDSNIQSICMGMPSMSFGSQEAMNTTKTTRYLILSSYKPFLSLISDVVNSGKGGDNVTFRFRTDNPGPWFLHCHIDWHLETVSPLYLPSALLNGRITFSLPLPGTDFASNMLL